MSFKFMENMNKNYINLKIPNTYIVSTFDSLNKEYFNTDIDITFENLSIDQTLSIINKLSNIDINIGIENFLSNMWEGIKKFFIKLAEWIKTFFVTVTNWFKKVIRSIYYFFTNKLDIIDTKNDTVKERLVEAAKNINEKINNIKKPFILTDEYDQIVDFAYKANEVLLKFIDAIANNEKAVETLKQHKTLISLIIENSSSSNLPDWLDEGLRNDNWKLTPNEHTLSEMCDNMKLPEINGNNVIDVYKKYGTILKQHLDNNDKVSQKVAYQLLTITKKVTSIGESIIDNNSVGLNDSGKERLLNNLKVATTHLAMLVTQSTTNQLNAFNEVFRIFESELKELLTEDKIRVTSSNDSLPRNIAEVLNNVPSSNVTTFEGYKIYKYIDIYTLFTDDIDEAKKEDADINAAATRLPFIVQPIITVCSGMLNFANNTELECVYSHEIGHIQQHHNLFKLSKDIYKRSTFKDTNYLNMHYKYEDVLKTTYRSLKNELEADCYSIKYCGFDTTIKFLTKLHLRNPIQNKSNIRKNGKIRFGYKDENKERLEFFKKYKNVNQNKWPEWMQKILN